MDPIGERVYRSVKAHVLGVAYPGRRIDLAKLAEMQQASLTPIRAALHRLNGEGLVEMHPHEGFRTPPLTLGGLRDLYEWNRRLLMHAVPPSISTGQLRSIGGEAVDETSAVAMIGWAFRAISRVYANVEGERAVASLNDRLHRVRLFELNVFADARAEAEAVVGAVGAGDVVWLRNAVNDYHRRRQRSIGDILDRAERA